MDDKNVPTMDTPNPSKEDILKMTQDIIEWTLTQDFPPRKDDRIITKFLIGAKYRVDVVKKKLKNFHNLRKKYGIWFEHRDPGERLMQDQIKVGLLLPLGEAGMDGMHVVLGRPFFLNASTYHLDRLIKTSLTLLDLIIDMDDSVLERGVHVILDLRGISLRYLMQITPKHLWLIVQLWQNIYPIRIKSIHLFNCPTYANLMVTVLKTFMSEKLRTRLHNHGMDQEVLLKSFPANRLPEEYGGTGGSVTECIDKWRVVVDANRERIIHGDLFCG